MIIVDNSYLDIDGIEVVSAYEYEKLLKELEIQEKKINPLIQLRDKLNYKASDEVKVKALAFWFNGITIVKRKGFELIEAVVYPIEGYNKTAYLVRIMPLNPINKSVCFKYNIESKTTLGECQGYRTNGFCSHILAVLYKLTKSTGYKGEYYHSLKSKALNFLKKEVIKE